MCRSTVGPAYDYLRTAIGRAENGDIAGARTMVNAARQLKAPMSSRVRNNETLGEWYMKAHKAIEAAKKVF